MRHLGAFFVVTIATTIVLTLYLVGLPVLIDQSGSVGEIWSGFSFVLIFVAPITFVGGLIAGVPVYVFGTARGWFSTVWRSVAAGASAGTVYAAVVALFATDWRAYPLLSLTLGGSIAGAVAGALWYAMLRPVSRTEAQ